MLLPGVELTRLWTSMATACNLALVVTKANRVSTEAGQRCTQVVGLSQTQRSEEANVTQISDHHFQLTVLLNQVQQDLHQYKQTLPVNLGAPGPTSSPVMVQGVPVEDAVDQS
jgi:hypothetical protein